MYKTYCSSETEDRAIPLNEKENVVFSLDRKMSWKPMWFHFTATNLLFWLSFMFFPCSLFYSGYETMGNYTFKRSLTIYNVYLPTVNTIFQRQFVFWIVYFKELLQKQYNTVLWRSKGGTCLICLMHLTTMDQLLQS